MTLPYRPLLVALYAVGIACDREPAVQPIARSRPRVHPLTNADPSTVESKTVVVDGKATKVTSFQRPKADSAAIEALATKCERGDLKGCVDLGMAQQTVGDNNAVIAAWTKACDGKEAAGCFELGNMLTNPFLKLGREAEGISALETGCELGHANCCYFLAVNVDKGQNGVDPDPGRARKLYEQGCDDGRGNFNACEALK